MARNGRKLAIYDSLIFLFLQICKKLEAKRKVFHVITFHLIKIQISWKCQNDHQILSFIKAMNVVGKKMARKRHEMARKRHKMANSQDCLIHFRSEFICQLFCCLPPPFLLLPAPTFLLSTPMTNSEATPEKATKFNKFCYCAV